MTCNMLLKEMLRSLVKSFELASDEIMQWFSINMVVNPGKFHLLPSSNDELKIYMNNNVINNSKCEKLDNKMKFSTHNDTCEKER